MNIFSTLSMCLHLLSAFSQEKDNPVHHGVFEGGNSWENQIDKMLEESDDGDTSRKWEDLSRSLRRTYQTWKDYK